MDDMYDSASQGGWIYRTGTIMCPYSSFMKYLSVLNNDCDLFFQRPKSKLPENRFTWFDAIGVEKSTLGDKIKTLSVKKKLSKVTPTTAQEQRLLLFSTLLKLDMTWLSLSISLKAVLEAMQEQVETRSRKCHLHLSGPGTLFIYNLVSIILVSMIILNAEQ